MKQHWGKGAFGGRFGRRNGPRHQLVTLLIAGALLVTACTAKKDTDSGAQLLKVGATPVPHAELLELVEDDLAAEDIILEIVEYTNTVQANVAVITGELDANYLQHRPYLEINEYWMARLTASFGVHIEPFGFYSSKYRHIAERPPGASIASPHDISTGGRALLVLQSQGLITLKPDRGLRPEVSDITGNPRQFQFLELDIDARPFSLEAVDAAGINGGYALQAGLNPINDSLIIEGAETPYVNVVVVRRDKEQDPRIQALKKALLSQEVKAYIGSRWSDGSIVPVF
jgi:D-methionine transport system substrate-binding protein